MGFWFAQQEGRDAMSLLHGILKKAGVMVLAAGMLALGPLALAADAAPQEGVYLQLLGTKGGPSLLQVEALPQSMAIVTADGIAIVDAGYGASYRLVESGLKLRATSARSISRTCTVITSWTTRHCS